jgi:hypothetical protein
MACGAEMMLMNVDRDDSMALLGCAHHTLKCPECQDVKWHLAFIRHNRASPPMPVQAAPPVVPASTKQDARPGLFRRSAAKIRRWAAKSSALGLRAANQFAKLAKFCPAARSPPVPLSSRDDGPVASNQMGGAHEFHTERYAIQFRAKGQIRRCH